MADPTQADKERTEFLRTAQEANPELVGPVKFILQHAPAPLNTVGCLRDIFNKQDITVALLAELHDKIRPEELEPRTTVNSIQCDVWSFYGVLLMLQGKIHQAIEVLDALYARILFRQSETGKRFHKGLPLFHISQCYQALGHIVHAKRYMMLTLCEDAISDKGALNLQNSGSYGRLAWVYGLSDRQILSYVTQAYTAYQENAADAAMPEWILQRFDQEWKTEVPSDQEAGTYHITKRYCERLMGQLGGGDGKALERLAQYLVGSMPGCRAYLRGRTFSTDHDVVASVEGSIADFRSELGRYFVCECKDRKGDKASFSDVAKFCRVLDSVKAKLGVIFSPNGLTGEGEAENADREVLKVYQDRGIIIVVVNRDDLQGVAEGANFISLLREKYEIVRLDLRQALGRSKS
jgi:hypothetical protein